jgi:hypothetical protein
VTKRKKKGADAPAAGRRHLAYHLCPMDLDGGVRWRWNADELKRRWDLFDGRKVVGVSTVAVGGEHLEDVGAVRAYLPPDAEIVEVPNDPDVRSEVCSWVPVWDLVLADAADGDAVFYAHAKGVSYHPGHKLYEPTRRWAEIAYAVCLDDWGRVAGLLKDHPTCGPFVRVGKAFYPGIPDSEWHYGGSFFWARAGAVRAADWRGVKRTRVGVEAWPGETWKAEEAGPLFLSGGWGEVDLYSRRPGSYFERVVEPAFREWLAGTDSRGGGIMGHPTIDRGD